MDVLSTPPTSGSFNLLDGGTHSEYDPRSVSQELGGWAR